MMVGELLQIARDAGEIILSHYGQGGAVKSKTDESPLTLADTESHASIVAALERMTPGVPIISEEGELTPVTERAEWDAFWLVDPLDGTKEFLKQTGEFTVNIGLIDGGRPTLGVVYAPAVQLMYWTDGETAWKLQGSGPVMTIRVGEYREGTEPVLVASRDHAGPAVKALSERYPGAAFRSMGSSLKFCLVAEGAADIYLRDVPTMEWDTAAAHAVVLAAGAELRCLDGSALTYNKAEVRNPAIVTIRPGAGRLLKG